MPVLILLITRARAEARVLEAHFDDTYRATGPPRGFGPTLVGSQTLTSPDIECLTGSRSSCVYVGSGRFALA